MTRDRKGAEIRLATYGTLAPGQPNHHILKGLNGTWVRGWVSGTLRNAGWGAAQGYPGIELNPAGNDVEVHVFQSEELVEHWARLDEFEGDGYQRQVAQVRTQAGMLEASIYALAV